MRNSESVGRRRNNSNEDDLPAEKTAKTKGAWFPQTYGNQKWAQCAEAQTFARQEAPFRVGGGRAEE